MAASKPHPPTLTIDSVIFQMVDDQLSVLVIDVVTDPFRGQAALPGGFCGNDETTRAAMDRILQTKAGLQTTGLGLIEQLYSFDSVGDQLRGHVISVSYLGLAYDIDVLCDSHTQSPRFVELSKLPVLAYDQQPVVDYALTRLRSKLTYTTAAAALLPETFTVFTLHSLYEKILGYPLDIRNFRKKFLSFNVLERTDQLYKSGPRRPAYLYRFKDRQLRTLNREF